MCLLWDVVKEHYSAGQTANGNIIRCMLIAYWIPKSTNTHTQNM